MQLSVPIHDLWWLISRASAVIALVLITATVLLGLAMATRTLRDPGRRRTAMKLHEDIALVSLAMIAVHGLTLLGDAWLKPGLSGIAVPFSMPYRPLYTGLGIIAGYLALLLGPSFYLRRRIKARRWRKVHRLTPVVWVFAVVHTLGAGTDSGSLWLRAIVLSPIPVLAYLLTVRLLSGGSSAEAGRRRQASAGATVAARLQPDSAAGARRRVAGQLQPERGPAAR